jgi:RNA polymerase sigma-70 factor, ECF subfamily
MADELMDLVQETQCHVRCYIAGIGVPHSDVDDIAQDVYVEFMRHPDRCPTGVAPLAWMKGIARNLCHSYFRARSRRGAAMRRISDTLVRDAERTTGGPLTEDALPALKRCIELLPLQRQQLLRRYYDGDRDASAIAEGMNRPADWVRKMMMRLRLVLRECVERALASEAST